MAREIEQLLAQGQRLKELRRPLPTEPGKKQRWELTQPTVAEAAGVSLRAYAAWEAGESDMEWKNAEALAKFHGVDPRWIFEGDRGPTQLDRVEAKLDAVLDLVYGVQIEHVESRRAKALAVGDRKGARDRKADVAALSERLASALRGERAAAAESLADETLDGHGRATGQPLDEGDLGEQQSG